MPFKTIRRKFLGFHHLTTEQFKDPKLDIPDLYGYDIRLNDKDLSYPKMNGGKTVYSEKPLRPFKLEFGFTPAQVIKVLGKPVVRIDNSMHIPGHMVMVFKHRIWAYGSCCQAHFRDKRLFLVIDEIKKPFQPGLFVAESILNGMGYDTVPIPEETGEITRLTDAQQNLMLIEEEIFVTVRVQQAN